MTKELKQQVEARGVKELGSLKGVEALSVQELQEIEGGLRIVIGTLRIVERDGSREKGHRWRWGWQDEW